MKGALRVGISGVGLLGPGLTDWARGRDALADPARWHRAPTVVPPATRLPATARRRAGPLVNASVGVADQACTMAGLGAADLATVFSSSTGDPVNCHLLCEALAQPERTMSPTRFTNSVHNAAAGYWHIAVGSRQPSTSLCAFDDSFAGGLLEAVTQCLANTRPVLLVVCDLPYPEPMHALRPIEDLFACALLLLPDAGAARWQLAVRLGSGLPASRCADGALEGLRRGVPAARALPLLQALARPGPGLALPAQADLALELEVGA